MKLDLEIVTPINSCRPGDVVTVSGVISSVCLHPVPTAPSLEIEVADDTGQVTVVWLGRREIPGIEPGRRIVVCGRLTHMATRPAIYNPRYVLRPWEGING